CRKCCTRATISRRARPERCCRSSAEHLFFIDGRRTWFAARFISCADQVARSESHVTMACVRQCQSSMRLALGLEYSGTPFTGWQSQPDGASVQDAVERALAAIAGVPLRVTAAGRTD